jgi:hypothetical protein
MNKAMKKDLEAVINSIVNEDADAGIAAFHNYIRAKSQQILLGEKVDDSDDEDDDSDDEDDDSDDEDDEKPAFLKKKAKKKDQKKAKDEDEE